MNNWAQTYSPSALSKWILFISCAIWSSFGFSQSDVLISGNYENFTVASVLEDWSLRYDVKVAFDSYELNKFTDSWSFEAEALPQALKSLLRNTGFTFRVLEETILIYFNPADDFNSEIDSLPTELNIRLQGEVRDIFSGELLPYASLYFANYPLSASTDVDGRFDLNIPLKSLDTLFIFFVGYETAKILLNRNVVGNKIRIRLEPQRNYLPDVLVEAKGVRSVISSEDPGVFILNPGNMTTTNGTGESDVIRAAQILPGVSGTQESSNGLFIRGSSNDQILLSMDGFNIYQQDHFFGAFSVLNTNAIKAISISKGVTDAKYGGRIGGIVEVAGKEGNLKQRNTQIELSPLSVGLLLEGPLDTAGKSSVFISARRAYTGVLFTPTYRSLFNTTYNAAITSADNNKTQAFGDNPPEYYFQDLNAKISFRMSEKNIFNITTFLSRDDLFVQYADTSDRQLENPRDVNYEDESTKRSNGVSLRWLHTWNTIWESSMRIGLSNLYGEYFSSDSIFNLLFEIDSVRFNAESTHLRDLDARWDFTRKMKSGEISFGVELNELRSNLKQNEMGNIIADSSVSGRVFSSYFSANTLGFGKLKINPGLRMVHFSRNKQWYPEPRLIIDYILIPEKWKLKFAAGRTNQFIQRSRNQNLYQNTPDFWQLAKNTDVPVLSCDQISLGSSFSFLDITLDIETFLKKNEGIITDQNFLTDGKLFNGSATIYGVDLMLQKDYKRHHFLAAYSWLNATADFPTANLFDISLFYWINHEVKFNYELKLKNWSINALWVYSSGGPFTSLLGSYSIALPDGTSREMPVYGKYNSSRLPDYHRLDLTLAWKKNFKNCRLEIVASVFNVYNRSNVRNIQYVVLNNYNDAGRLSIGQRNIGMLGLLPSLMMRLQF